MYLQTTLTAFFLALANDPAPSTPGTASGEQSASPSTLAWGDFDGDQLPDVYVSVAGGPDRLLRNLGGGEFEPVTLDGLHAGGSRLALWQDVDGDGDLDLYVASHPGPGRLLTNLGDGLFEPAPGALPPQELGEVQRASWLDFDRDGAPDLFLEGKAASALLRNDGRGILAPVGLALGGGAAASTFVDSARVFEGASPLVEPEGTEPEGERTPGATLPGRRAPVDVSSTGLVSPGASPIPGTSNVVTPGGALPLGGACMSAIADQGSGTCLPASSVPTLGALYPMTSKLFVSASSGYVGINTTSPADDLHVNGGIRLKQRLRFRGSNETAILSPTTGTLTIKTEGGERMRITDTGRVGIGTTNPLSPLHVQGDIFSSGDIWVDESIRLGGGFFNGMSSTVAGELNFLGGGATRMHITPAGDVGIGTTTPTATLDVAGTVEGDQVRADYGSSTTPTFRFGNGTENSGLSSPGTESVAILTDGQERFRINQAGKVGIGTSTPTGTLQVEGAGSGISGATIRSENSSVGSGIALYARTFGSDSTAVFTQSGSGSILRGFNGGGSPVFEVRNSGRCVTSALQITGGGDLVEGFDTGERACEPGTVVCIDPESPGRLMPAGEAYDSKVAGVVSGAGGVNHGIRMGQDDVLDGDTLVAMTGRVYVKCTDANGAIQPGDLLTTAALEGHAMKASDPERSFGAVIGKAMTSLDSGTGLVLVLVNLQ